MKTLMMMMMFSLGVTSNTCHEVEFTVISAEQLMINGRPIKNKAFATVRTGDGYVYSTGINEDSGHCTCWNEKLKVNLPWSSRDVVVEVLRRGSSGDRILGSARIPVSDFTGEYFVPVMNHLHFLSYRLRDAKGVRNGIINISVRVMSAAATSSSSLVIPEAPTSAGFRVGSHQGAVTGYPVRQAGTGLRHDGFKSR